MAAVDAIGVALLAWRIAYVSLGREGNATLAAELQATRSWTTIAAKDLRGVGPITTRYGVNGQSVIDNVARPGTLSFWLNNGVTNSGRLQGYYTPGHTNCRSGFGIGIPIRWGLTDPTTGFTHYKFRGRLTAIVPTPGEYREQQTQCTATGWMDVAANTVLPTIAAQTLIRSDQAAALVLDETEGRSPAAIALSTDRKSVV